MIKDIITIDVGTTNTRVSLWRDEELQEVFVYSQGVQNASLAGNNDTVKKILECSIKKLFKKYNILAEKTVIIASGMITSAFGLVEIPHLNAPVGIQELAISMKQFSFPEVCPQPIWFIPGVKTQCQDKSRLSSIQYDVMRGEETEAMAVFSLLKPTISDEHIFVMPGTHTKFIKLDKNGRIVKSKTATTGEILSLLTKKSLIATDVHHRFYDEIDESYLLSGFHSARSNGIGSAVFDVRILGQTHNASRNQRANYLLGAVLSSDIQLLENFLEPNETVVLTGKKELREAIHVILNDLDNFSHPIIIIEANDLAGRDALLAGKKRGLLRKEG